MPAADSKYPRYKNREDVPCQCEHPCCSRIADRTISRKPKRNGLVRVRVFCDCLLCGPFSFECEKVPEFIAGNLLRSTVYKPARGLGQPRNAVMRNRG